MTHPTYHPALLPTGLADVLPPAAETEAAAAERAMAVFRSEGYERAAPPMLEFEDSFLRGAGEGLARETFRMMDPQSQRMLALRSDMTPQIARIAATRLANAPRPLRLCYLGAVLRVSGGSAGGPRQLRQAGAELIGSREPAADAEIVLLAVSALQAVGLDGVSVDLNVPRMAGDLTDGLDLPPTTKQGLMRALDRKDAAEIRRLAPGAADVLTALTVAGGNAEQALEAAADIDLPPSARERITRLADIIALIKADAPDLAITIDFVEHRGFDYHTGVAFSLFANGYDGELGRGGRYRAPTADGAIGDTLDDDALAGEHAVGFTLFMDAADSALPKPEAPLRVYVPLGAPSNARAKIHKSGHISVRALAADNDVAGEARRLGCGAIWRDGKIISVKEG